MKYEVMRNVRKTYVFRKSVPPGASGHVDCDVVAHGYVDSVKVRFAAGENGTLQIRPTMIIPQEIELDLFSYPSNGAHYVTGDNEVVESDVRFETENHAVLRVYYGNTATDGADSIVNVDIGLTYFEVIEAQNIIGNTR